MQTACFVQADDVNDNLIGTDYHRRKCNPFLMSRGLEDHLRPYRLPSTRLTSPLMLSSVIAA